MIATRSDTRRSRFDWTRRVIHHNKSRHAFRTRSALSLGVPSKPHRSTGGCRLQSGPVHRTARARYRRRAGLRHRTGFPPDHTVSYSTTPRVSQIDYWKRSMYTVPADIQVHMYRRAVYIQSANRYNRKTYSTAKRYDNIRHTRSPMKPTKPTKPNVQSYHW